MWTWSQLYIWKYRLRISAILCDLKEYVYQNGVTWTVWCLKLPANVCHASGKDEWKSALLALWEGTPPLRFPSQRASNVDRFSIPWCHHKPITGYLKLRVVHALEMPGTFSPPPASKETASQRSRHVSRHVRHARAVMHVGMSNPRWWGECSRHSRHMRNPQFYVSGKRPIIKPNYIFLMPASSPWLHHGWTGLNCLQSDVPPAMLHVQGNWL